MVIGIILVVIAILLIYSVFFWMPGRESRREDMEEKENDSK